MTEPGPLFAAGDPSDRQTGGMAGAVIAVVLLVLGSGATALFSLFVLPFAGDACGDSDTTLICTADGQRAVIVGPFLAAAVGTVVAACSLAARSPYRALGITLGYVISFGVFLIAWVVASQA
ncbi:hypothetical protein [Actinoplanes sp. NPDC026623]|uniref:hypothetical protein n=1 Tax=Actinoplanes sp. NPDC026623 TaxID=3155610 RepID=UPI0033D1243F